MKNNFLKISFTIFAMVMLLCAFAMIANAAAGDAVSNGVTDTGFAWALTESDEAGHYVLTITDTEASKELTTFSYTVDGQGPDKKVFPWGTTKHRNVVEIVYKANASTLGSYVFWDAWELRKVTLPKTVTTLEADVFRTSTKLATIAVEGENLGENTLNFKYLTQILPEYQYTRQFVGCFSREIDYKIYFSLNTYLPSISHIYGFATDNDEWVNLNGTLAKTSRFDAGDVVYYPDDYSQTYRLGLLRNGLGFTIAVYPKDDGYIESGITSEGFKWTITGDATEGYVLTVSDTETSKALDYFSLTSALWTGKYSFAKFIIEADIKEIGSLDGCRAAVLVIPKSVTKTTTNFYTWNGALHSILVAGETYPAIFGECIVDFRNLSGFPSALQFSFDYTKDITFLFPKFGWIGSFGSFATIHNSQTDNLGNGYNIGAGDVFYVESDWGLRASLEEIAKKIGFTVKVYPGEEVTESAMEMYGYQVRTEGYNGLRGIFNFNENVTNEGFTLVEYGAILAADANRGENDANIKLSYVDGEYKPAGNKIIKLAVKQNGDFVDGVKTLKKLNDREVDEIKGEGYTWFATTLVNFERNFKDDVYMCGYEIWKSDLTGETSIIYTGYEYPEYEATSIYDVSIGLIADGFTNDLVNNPVGQVMKAAGAVTLTSTDAVLPAGATSLVAENIEMMGYASGAFTSGTVYYSLYSMMDGNYLAYISGSGNLDATALKTTYASDYAGDARPVPTLLTSAHNKITHIVVAEGIVDLSYFGSMKKLEVIIYPESLKTINTSGSWGVFQNCTLLRKIVPVGTVTNENIFEFGNVTHGGGNNYQAAFQNCSSVEYIHLSKHSGGTYTFENCTNLKAVWVGDVVRPADGTVDFRKSGFGTIYLNALDGTTRLNTLLLADNVADYRAGANYTIKTVYQAAGNEKLKTYFESVNITFTTTLPG